MWVWYGHVRVNASSENETKFVTKENENDHMPIFNVSEPLKTPAFIEQEEL